MRAFSFVCSLMVFFVIVAVWGCSERRPPQQPKADAVAVLVPTEGNTASGIVRLTRTDDGVRIMARLTGLEPGLHGFHVHEYGDCRAADAGSAGGHFNPTGQVHGAPDAEQRHAGDLGNVEADDQGVATLDMIAPAIQLGGPDAVIGRSVIVHADPDDMTSQPTGASGGRLACGVIGWAAR